MVAESDCGGLRSCGDGVDDAAADRKVITEREFAESGRWTTPVVMWLLYLNDIERPLA